MSAGSCVEEAAAQCSESEPCPDGFFCRSGRCRREYGACRSDDQCPSGAICRREPVLVAAADSDGDEIPDALDNCPDRANVTQADSNANGIGDACEAALVSPTPTATSTETAAPTQTPIPTATATSTAAPDCAGDCDGDGEVAIDEIVRGVRIALGTLAVDRCPRLDSDRDGRTNVDDLLRAVRASIEGCAMARFSSAR